MKPKPGYILYFLGAAIFLCVGAQAQEAYPLEDTGNERDGTYSRVDGETRSHLRVTETESMEFAAADTSSYAAPASSARAPEPQPGTFETEGSAQSGNQESVLGFNFLYYIIQKFKMSDIVEK